MHVIRLRFNVLVYNKWEFEFGVFRLLLHLMTKVLDIPQSSYNESESDVDDSEPVNRSSLIRESTIGFSIQIQWIMTIELSISHNLLSF